MPKPTAPMHPEYKREYNSTPAKCECPARAFNPSTPCKHMQHEQALAEQYRNQITQTWDRPPLVLDVRSLDEIAGNLQRLIDRGRMPKGAQPFVKYSHQVSTRDGLVTVYRVDRRALAIRLRQIVAQKIEAQIKNYREVA